MNFVQLTEKQYQKYWENHPLKTFLSAIEIAKLRKTNNWNVDYVGVKQDNNLIAATMLLSHKRHFNRYEFYSPRGFLLDYNNRQLLEFFTKEIFKFIKNKKGYVLRIDPYVINKQRDIDGEIVENGLDNTNVVDHLLKLGYKKVPTNKLEQVSWMFSLDLEGKTEEQILKEMKPNTRNTIRKKKKNCISIKELTYDELEKFQNIMIETGERKGFAIRDVSYYQEMYKLFHSKEQIKYYITELNLNDYINNLKIEKTKKEEKIANLGSAKYNDAQKKNLENEILSYEKRIVEALKIKEKVNKDTITLSGSMFIMIKPEIVYLSSGNYEEYMKFNSQYLLQWKMIKYGLENGFKKYNFYGIPANINTHPKDYGIYEFKRGFNGYVEELIGEFELPISWHYYLFHIIHKLKGGKK